VAILLLAVACY